MSDDKPNWRSKSMVAHMGHLGIALAGLVGVLVDHASAGTIVPAWIGGHLGIAGLHNTSTAATERAQANSPNYPLPPVPVSAPNPRGEESVLAEPPPAPTSGPGIAIKPPS